MGTKLEAVVFSFLHVLILQTAEYVLGRWTKFVFEKGLDAAKLRRTETK